MAVRDFIKVDTTVSTAKFAPDILRMIQLLRDVINQVEKVKNVMDHNNDSTVFTDIEALFGLAAGSGQNVYNLVAGCRSAVRSASTLEIIDRVG